MRRTVLAAICLALCCGMTVSAADEKKAPDKPVARPVGEPVIAHIELNGVYAESPPLPGLFGDVTENLATVLARFDKAADDAQVDHVIVHIKNVGGGWGRVSEFRRSIARLRAKGKKTHAYLEGGAHADYLIAAACDEVVMPESGVLMLIGLRAEVSFYKDLLDRVGVEADILRVGEFKSAAEPFSRTDMSPEFRKEMDEVLDDLYAQLIAGVSESRHIERAKVEALVDAGPFSAEQAKASGLVDRLAYEDELSKSLEDQYPANRKAKIALKYGKKKIDTDFTGLAGLVKFMELLSGAETPQRRTFTPKIAVIYATGPIVMGKSQADIFDNETTVGAETMAKAIREANKNEWVKAIVLRINSPGGSAMASDLIWRELERVEKPFVVSMGDVAASGGYYIAQGADRIFAEAATITGSIGVVGGKLAFDGLFKKIGINTTVLSRGKNSGVFSMTTKLSATEREALQKLLDEIYEQFTAKAAKGRKMEKADLEKLARGRIYSGQRAKELGLVDAIGSLDDAVAEAQKRAGLPADQKVERLQLPKPTSPLEQLFGGNLDTRLRLRAQPADLAGLRELFPEMGEHWAVLRALSDLTREPALFLLPYHLRIR